MEQQQTHYHYHLDPDSIEIGTPGKGGCIKVYGDCRNPEDFRRRIQAAHELRKFANDLINEVAR